MGTLALTESKNPYLTMSAHNLSLPEMRTEATRLLASGSEHLEDGNYTHAAADLGAASELFAKVFGETGEECGEAYLLYGKSLLNVSIMENEVLGNARMGWSLKMTPRTFPRLRAPRR